MTPIHQHNNHQKSRVGTKSLEIIMTFLSEEDKNLFRQAIQGVRPLASKTAPEILQAQIERRRTLKRRQPSPQPDENDFEIEQIKSTEQHSVSAFETIQFERHKLKAKDWKKLKSGRFHTYWQLDLHGETLESADRILCNFLQEAHQQNARYAILIHGKGHHSESETPILKNLVNQRLRQLPFVLAFCSAQPKDGGTGAVYVFLKNVR